MKKKKTNTVDTLMRYFFLNVGLICNGIDNLLFKTR